MNTMEVIIVRLWYVLIYNTYYKLINRMLSAYRGIKASITPYEKEAKCKIIVEKYKLKKLKSPFSGHIDFFIDNQLYIWQVDTSNCKKDQQFVKPDEITNEHIREYNTLPKLTIAYKLQNNILE